MFGEHYEDDNMDSECKYNNSELCTLSQIEQFVKNTRFSFLNYDTHKQDFKLPEIQKSDKLQFSNGDSWI